jgi:hypothetical protein
MAKKAKRKGSSRALQSGNGEPLDSLPYYGLIVKISAKIGGEVGGKMFLIRETDLHQYLFTPQNQAAFDAAITATLVNVDYAIFAPDFTTQGSAGG